MLCVVEIQRSFEIIAGDIIVRFVYKTSGIAACVRLPSGATIIYLCLSFSLSLYIYIYMYIYVYM